MAKPRRPAPDEYEVRDAAHTLKRAHEIRKDRHLMRHVKKHVKSEASNMQQLSQMLGNGPAGAGAGGMAQPAPGSLGEAFGP